MAAAPSSLSPPIIPGIQIHQSRKYDHHGYRHDIKNGDFKRSTEYLAPWVCVGLPASGGRFGETCGISKPDDKNQVPDGNTFGWVNNTGNSTDSTFLIQSMETSANRHMNITYSGFGFDPTDQARPIAWTVRFGNQSVVVNQMNPMDANIPGDQWPQWSHLFDSIGQDQVVFEVPGNTMFHVDKVQIHCLNCHRRLSGGAIFGLVLAGFGALLVLSWIWICFEPLVISIKNKITAARKKRTDTSISRQSRKTSSSWLDYSKANNFNLTHKIKSTLERRENDKLSTGEDEEAELGTMTPKTVTSQAPTDVTLVDSDSKRWFGILNNGKNGKEVEQKGLGGEG